MANQPVPSKNAPQMPSNPVLREAVKSFRADKTQQNLNAVCRQNARRQLCELIRLDAAVIGNRNTALHCTRTIALDQVCQTLRCRTDGKTVHAVQSDTKNAAQTCGTEGQRCIKTILNFLFVVLNCRKLSVLLRAQRRGVHPLAIFFHVAHLKHLLLIHCNFSSIGCLCLLSVLHSTARYYLDYTTFP